MLYVTTRDNKQTYTLEQALKNSVAPDGGRFVPQQLPEYDSSEIIALTNHSFSETVAHILNTLFVRRLSGWDVELVLGKAAPRMVTMNHRIAVAEMWHNPEGRIGYITDGLFSILSEDDMQHAKCSDWFEISVNIAVLFGLYGEMLRTDVLTPGQSFDISVPAEDFVVPMAGYYARKMGLPIGTIVCTCDETSPVWDIIQRGTFSTSMASSGLLMGIERLISAELGSDAVDDYLVRQHKKLTYSVPEECETFADGFFCAVTGEPRAASIINSVYRNNTYFVDPHTALCLGGLQDYRAKHGSVHVALVPAVCNPAHYAKEIETATGQSF